MNRYYIDTNILIFLITANGDEELSGDIKGILSDYSNMFLVSSVCVKEVIHLCQTGRLKRKLKAGKGNRAQDAIRLVRDMGVRIMPVNEYHLREYSELRLVEDHSDPDDRLIIARRYPTASRWSAPTASSTSTRRTGWSWSSTRDKTQLQAARHHCQEITKMK